MKNTIKVRECNSEEKDIDNSMLENDLNKNIEALYNVVAGLEIVNQIHMRKLKGLNYKYGNSLNISLNEFQIEKLYRLDRIYWDFTIDKECYFRFEDQNKLNIYHNKRDYDKTKIKYSIYYQKERYRIIQKSENKDSQICESEDILVILNWIVADSNRSNFNNREKYLNNIGIKDELRLKLTQPYVNDIGLDVMVMLNSVGVKFELMHRLQQFKRRCNGKEGKKCSNATSKIFKLNNDSTNELNIHTRLIENSGIDTDNKNNNKGRFDKIIELIKKANQAKENLSEMELLFNKNYLDVRNSMDETELIIRMCEYDLAISIDEEGMYNINKVVTLSGITVKLFEINKILSEKELVKWLFLVKKAEVESFDYFSF